MPSRCSAFSSRTRTVNPAARPSLRARVANSTVTNNENGLVQSDIGVLLSRGDNTVEGNTTDLVGTIGSFSPR